MRFREEKYRKLCQRKSEIQPGHILDLYCIIPLNAARFCENYTKLYFDAKHLEKGLNSGGGGVKFIGPFFQKSFPFFMKKCPFWPTSSNALNF